jgi:hypothetical protein
VKEDVVSLEHGVGFEFAAPVAVGVLLRQDVVRGTIDGRLDFSQICIKPPESGSCGLLYYLPLFHAI